MDREELGPSSRTLSFTFTIFLIKNDKHNEHLLITVLKRTYATAIANMSFLPEQLRLLLNDRLLY